jgi:hypothetical protein
MSGQKQRWYWYSQQTAPVGTKGPFGPIEARVVREAYEIAGARARNAGLTLDSCVAAYHIEPSEDEKP